MSLLLKVLRAGRGFTLVEAILASFLLLTAVLMSVSVFDSSLQAEASNEKRIMAALVAESALAEIRQAGTSNFNQVKSLYDGRSWSVPEYPGFEVRSTIASAEIAVPCTVLESQYNRDAEFPAPAGRYLSGSTLKADVAVSWQDAGGQSVQITEYIANFGAANDFSVQILLPDGSLAAAGTVIAVPSNEVREFSARAVSGGQVIEDIQFSWYVQALTGHGSIETVSRDGEQCQYINAYRNFDNTKKFAPGACDLVLQATYQGLEVDAKLRIENAP